jgi:hypothetical protein
VPVGLAALVALCSAPVHCPAARARLAGEGRAPRATRRGKPPPEGTVAPRSSPGGPPHAGCAQRASRPPHPR